MILLSLNSQLEGHQIAHFDIIGDVFQLFNAHFVLIHRILSIPNAEHHHIVGERSSGDVSYEFLHGKSCESDKGGIIRCESTAHQMAAGDCVGKATMARW